MLRSALHVLLKHRSVLFSAVLVITSIVAIVSFRMTPVYQAAARVEVDSDVPLMAADSNLRPVIAPGDDEFLRTQIEVLKTDGLAWRTIEQLRLDANPQFLGDLAAGRRVPKRKSDLIKRFRDHMEIDLLRGTRVIQVSFESTDPKLAAVIVNTHLQNYVDNNFHEKYNTARQASNNLEQQLEEMKAHVEQSQRALVDYERNNAIVNINDRQNVVEQRMGDLTHDLTVAQADRIEKEASYREIEANPQRIAMLAEDKLLQDLQVKQSDLTSQYVSALAQYGPAFPKVTRLKEQVDSLTQNIAEQRQNYFERVKRDYEAAARREAMLSAAVAEQKAELGNFNRLLVQENLLRGEFETNEQLYQRLLQHLKDATVEAGLRSTNIHIIDPAEIPDRPVRPRRVLNTAISFVGAVLLGIVLVFARESMDASVKSPEDIEVLLREVLLAIIPKVSRPRWRALQSDKAIPILSVISPKDSVAEAYRSLRSSILLSTLPHAPQVILVTSANPGEGKSSVSANLAVVLAQRGERVLLIDGDLRKPTIATLFGVDNRIGVACMLSKAATFEQVVVSNPDWGSLDIAPSGPIPDNPAELLSCEHFQQILTSLRRRYDRIVIDSPPVLCVTDATVLSTHADGIIVVVEAGVSSRKGLKRAARILRSVGGHILGIALNKVDYRHGYEYEYGTYYYHPRYGDEIPGSDALRSKRQSTVG